MSNTLRKYLVPEFVLGEGASSLISRYVKFYNPRKILLVTDPGLIKVGLIPRIEKQLRSERIPYLIYDNITPNPRDYQVMLGSEFYLKNNCDVILAVGGGSPMDAAKGIAIVSTNHQHINSFEGVDKISVPIPPLICVPTTAGTSADISQFAIILNSESKQKLAIISKAVVPDNALIDAETTLTMDNELTAATGIDALVHAIEAYVSNASSAITDINALEAIRIISKYLPLTLNSPENIEYRKKMMLASLLAGMAFSNASLGLVHAMAHALGGLKDAAHGICNAILIDHVINNNFDSAPKEYREIASAFGVDLKYSDKNVVKRLLIEKIREFKYECGIRSSLKDIGIVESDFQSLAEKAIEDPCIVTNPHDSNIEDIINVFRNAW